MRKFGRIIAVLVALWGALELGNACAQSFSGVAALGTFSTGSSGFGISTETGSLPRDGLGYRFTTDVYFGALTTLVTHLELVYGLGEFYLGFGSISWLVLDSLAFNSGASGTVGFELPVSESSNLFIEAQPTYMIFNGQFFVATRAGIRFRY